MGKNTEFDMWERISYKEADACAKELAEAMIQRTLGGKIALDYRYPLLACFYFAKYFTSINTEDYDTEEGRMKLYDLLAAEKIHPRTKESWSLVEELYTNIVNNEIKKSEEENSIDKNLVKLIKKIDRNISSPIKTELAERVIDSLLGKTNLSKD